MRKLLVLAIGLAACEPAGYYVANVYAVNGALVMSRCEISGYNRAPKPTQCHEETIVPAPAAPPPAYAPPPYQPPPPQTYPQSPPPYPQQPSPY